MWIRAKQANMLMGRGKKKSSSLKLTNILLILHFKGKVASVKQIK